LDTVHVIANPNAAGGKGARAIPELRRRLLGEGISAVFHLTKAPGHASELASRVREAGGERILVVGGDGTIHEVMNGLLAVEGPATNGHGVENELPLLAILPVGTGNDFHRMVRAPRGVDAAVELIRSGVPRSFDVGEVRWNGGPAQDGGRAHFVNLFGVGIDVAVLQRRPAFGRLPGILQYLAALGSALAGFRPIPLRVEWEGVEGTTGSHEAPALLAAVTVGPSIGGGFIISPAARCDDGLLDLFFVDSLGVGKVIRYLPGILRGSLTGKPEVRQVQASALVVSASDGRPFSFELDGEVMAQETNLLEVRVLRGRLRVLEMPDGGGA